VWDGVTNPVALKNLRAMKAGDEVFVYHTGAEKAVVGRARVARAAYPDPKKGNPRLVVVDLEPVGRLEVPVTLAEIKATPAFADSPLVRQGRLSVVPLTPSQWKAVLDRGRK
jgi:predicted RNA-binding protein with PUA-like domain